MVPCDIELTDELAIEINTAFSFGSKKAKRPVRQTQGKPAAKRISEAKANLETWKTAGVISDEARAHLKKHCLTALSRLGISHLVFPVPKKVTFFFPGAIRSVLPDATSSVLPDPSSSLPDPNSVLPDPDSVISGPETVENETVDGVGEVLSSTTTNHVVGKGDDVESAILKLAAKFAKKNEAKRKIPIQKAMAFWFTKENTKQSSVNRLLDMAHKNEIVGSLGDLPKSAAQLLKVKVLFI